MHQVYNASWVEGLWHSTFYKRQPYQGQIYAWSASRWRTKTKKDFTQQLKPEKSVVLSVDCSPALVLNWLVWRRDNFTSGLIFPRSPPTVLVCTSVGWLMAAADNFKTLLWMFVCFCIIIIMSINAVKVLKTSDDEECFECLQLLSRIMSLLSTTFYRFIISGALIKIDMAVD